MSFVCACDVRPSFKDPLVLRYAVLKALRVLYYISEMRIRNKIANI